MADTGKSIRASRTNLGGGVGPTGAPSERSQLVGQEVHQYRSLSTGLEGVSQALDNFFGLAIQGVGAVQDAVLLGEKQKIEQENASQKRQALGDALAGKPMDEKLSGDLDYYDAFRSVTAQRDGYKAYQDFNKFYLEEWLPANPTGDLMTARDEWASKNLMGSADPDYEGQVMASFFDKSDSMISQHQEYALKYQTAKGIENLGQAIDAEVASGTVTPAMLTSFIDKARALDPLNAGEAPARVVSALLSSADNHPDQMMTIANLLDQDGTGVNGKSFAQSWPDVYAQFQSKAVDAYNSINSSKELGAVTGLEDRIRNATSADDLISVGVDVMKFRQQFGAPGKTGQLMDQIAQAGAQFDKAAASYAQIDSWLQGDHSGDPADIRKNWTTFLADRTGTKNIMDLDTKDAAGLISGLAGVVPEEAKAQLSAAITDTRNPAAQAKAIETINTLISTTGKQYAYDYLSDTAKQMYGNVYAISQTTSEPMESILARVNEARDGVKDWSVDWKTITGQDTLDKGNVAARKVVEDTLWQALGKETLFKVDQRGITLPANVADTILDAARSYAVEAQANGRGWEAGVKDAALAIAANSEVIPGADGKLLYQINATKTTVYRDERGKEAIRPRLGYSVENPVTSKPVDTIGVYESQLKQLADEHLWALPDGTTDGISLAPNTSSELAARGLFEVRNDGQPVIFAAGQQVIIGSQKDTSRFVGDGVRIDQFDPAKAVKVTIPSTDAEMTAFAGDLPEGFMFVREDTIHGPIYRLGFRPNFGTETGKTLDQQITDFQPPAPQGPGMGIREMMTGQAPDPLWSN